MRRLLLPLPDRQEETKAIAIKMKAVKKSLSRIECMLTKLELETKSVLLSN